MSLTPKVTFFIYNPSKLADILESFNGPSTLEATYLLGHCTTHSDKARKGAEACDWGLMDGALILF